MHRLFDIFHYIQYEVHESYALRALLAFLTKITFNLIDPKKNSIERLSKTIDSFALVWISCDVEYWVGLYSLRFFHAKHHY